MWFKAGCVFQQPVLHHMRSFFLDVDERRTKLATDSAASKGATTGGIGGSGPHKIWTATPTFLMKSVIIVT